MNFFEPGIPFTVAEIDSPGDFGHQRYRYIHPGLDIYVANGTLVKAIEPGIVVAITRFTGTHAEPPTPWWNNTWSVLVEGRSGVIGYCELIPADHIKIGVHISLLTTIGSIIPVLMYDKGNGMTMLHLELYTHGTIDHVNWEDDQPCPKQLLNPRIFLK